MPKYDVLVVGDYFIDLIFTGQPGLPELGKEVFSTGFTMIAGGSYNAAVAMYRLGLKVGWAADFGNDEFSRIALEQVRAEKMDESLFVFHKRPLRRITTAISFPSERAFLTYQDPDPSIPAGFKRLPTASARLLFIPGLYYGSLFEAGIKMVRAKGMKLAMDCNVQNVTLDSPPSIRKILQKIDLFLPNAAEVRHLTGEDDLETGIRTLAKVCPLVVVKDGGKGAYACQGDTLLYSPPHPGRCGGHHRRGRLF